MGKTLSKPFRIGTTGWSADDLDDPRIETRWNAGRYELINGVLTKMPPAYFIGGEALANLVGEVRHQLKRSGVAGSFAVEVDLVIDDLRVVKGDACFLTPADKRKQAAAARARGRHDLRRARIYVPPTVVVESVSPGHRAHDRCTKLGWYAEFGVRHYWILDAFARTLDEYVLSRGQYKATGTRTGRDAAFTPAAFAGVRVALSDVWPDATA